MALSSDDGLAEEQRLFYVAVTRARDDLALYTPLRLPHHRRGRDDRHSFAPATRFLTDAALAATQVHEAPRPVRVAVAGGTPSVAILAAPVLDPLFD